MSTQPFTMLELERERACAWVTLNRPEKRNALNPTLLSELSLATAELDADPDVSVIVIRGAGPTFCAGYDISTDGDPERATRRARNDVMADWRAMRAYSRRWLEIWHLPTPTIAQVHGFCLAGGAELALNCDLVFAADDAVIGHPVVRDLGVPTANVYPYLVGLRRAKELALTGATLSGTEAAEIGLINRSLPAADLGDYVRAFALRVSEVPKALLSLNKLAVNSAYSAMGYETGIAAGATLDALAHTTNEVRQVQEEMSKASSIGRSRSATLRSAQSATGE